MASSLPLLYLCRHGETDWNAEARIQGQRDIPLNDNGRRQAARNGRYLRSALPSAADGFDFVASPLSRTRETMSIIRREIGLPADDLAADERLMELNFGDWQGFTMAELAERDPAAVARRERDKWYFRPPGGTAESYEMLARRVLPLFLSLERPTVIVAHGGISRVFLKMFGGMAPDAAAFTSIAQDRVLRFERDRYEWV